jgi:hypothetical protein
MRDNIYSRGFLNAEIAFKGNALADPEPYSRAGRYSSGCAGAMFALRADCE